MKLTIRVVTTTDDGQETTRDIAWGVLVKRGHLTRPSFGVSRTFGASRVPNPANTCFTSMHH